MRNGVTELHRMTQPVKYVPLTYAKKIDSREGEVSDVWELVHLVRACHTPGKEYKLVRFDA